MATSERLEQEIQDAYETWVKPRLSSPVPDHPAHAFEAGYRAALSAAEARAERYRVALERIAIHNFTVEEFRTKRDGESVFSHVARAALTEERTNG